MTKFVLQLPGDDRRERVLERQHLWKFFFFFFFDCLFRRSLLLLLLLGYDDDAIGEV